MDPDVGVIESAIIGTVHFAIAAGCWAGADYLAKRMKSPTGRRLTTWPLYGLAFVFGGSAALILLANMLGPVISLGAAIFGWARS